MSKNQEIAVKSAFSVPENELIDFYQTGFDDRINYLKTLLGMAQSSDYFDNKIPLVIEKMERLLLMQE